MPMVDVPEKLSEMSDGLVGRYVKTQLGLARGIEYDPPLLTLDDIDLLKREKVLPIGGALFGILAETEPFGPADLVAMWNMLGDPFPKVLKLTEDRRKKARARLKEIPSKENWKKILASIKESSWHRGENNSGWVATFDWLIRNSTVAFRILERVSCRGHFAHSGARQTESDMPDLGRM